MYTFRFDVHLTPRPPLQKGGGKPADSGRYINLETALRGCRVIQLGCFNIIFLANLFAIKLLMQMRIHVSLLRGLVSKSRPATRQYFPSQRCAQRPSGGAARRIPSGRWVWPPLPRAALAPLPPFRGRAAAAPVAPEPRAGVAWVSGPRLRLARAGPRWGPAPGLAAPARPPTSPTYRLPHAAYGPRFVCRRRSRNSPPFTACPHGLRVDGPRAGVGMAAADDPQLPAQPVV